MAGCSVLDQPVVGPATFVERSHADQYEPSLAESGTTEPVIVLVFPLPARIGVRDGYGLDVFRVLEPELG